MIHNHPDMLSDEALSMALDGYATPAVLTHLTSCDRCRARQHELALFDHGLTNALNRTDCPSLQTITDLVFGFLPTHQRAEIEAHIAQCASCRDDKHLVSDKALPRHAPPIFTAPIQWQDWHGQITARSSHLPYQFAGVEVRYTAEIDTATFNITIHNHDEEIWHLNGEIMADDHAEWIGSMVQLYQQNTLAHIGFVDEMGNFTFTITTTGMINVLLVMPTGTSVALPTLTI